MNRTSFIVMIAFSLVFAVAGGPACSSSSGSGIAVTFAPADAATGVALSISTAVTATFSTAITEPADWASAFTLIAEGASATSCTAVTYDAASRTATCTHGILTGETDYTMTISGVTDASGGTVTAETAAFTTAVPTAWTVEDGVRVTGRTSSSTIIMPDGTFRMYLAGVMTTTSSDGLTWEVPAFVSGAQDMSANAAILAHSSGTYILISEIAGDERRFYRYSSSDGISFTPTPGSDENGSVLSPSESDAGFISVPDMIELPDGSIRLYYVSAGDHTESATSTDLGVTWTREGRVTISGIPDGGYWMVDPDVLELDDGRYWLFFATTYDEATGEMGMLRIRSALSTDGRSFTMESGERLSIGGDVSLRIDPDVILLSDGTYRMYYGEEGSSGPGLNLKSAISPD